MIKIGGKIGAFNTIGLIFLTAFVGLFFARIQGIKTLRSGLINLYQNKTPIYDMMSGASIAFAALLLIIPGFFTDLMGFLLLVPFTRKIIFKILIGSETSIKKPKKKEGVIDGEVVNKEKDEL